MVRRVRLGVIVPSSNTVVEPLTQAIVASITDPELEVSVHFSRFRVTKIDLSGDANSQFSRAAMVAAAQLLGDAEVDVIGWSGTSAGWLGFETDENLCREIQEATGIPATSSILALNELLRTLKPLGARRKTAGANTNAELNANANVGADTNLGLVTPYLPAVVDAIRNNYAALGFPIAPERERHLGLIKNLAIGLVTEAQLDEMISEVVNQGADVVAIYCTNLRGARRATAWEKLHGIVVLDSVATTVWGMLKAVHISPSAVRDWGLIFGTQQ